MSSRLRSPHGPACLAGITALCGLFLSAACTSPHPQPFQDFSKATAGAGTTTGKALKESIAQSRDALIDSVRDPQTFHSLKLYFRADPGAYVWGNQPDGRWKDVSSTPPTPLPLNLPPTPESEVALHPPSPQWINYYYKPQRLAQEIEDFNQVLTQYSSLLATLANREFLPEDDFKKMATSLNTRASQIGRLSGTSLPRETAIFSTASMALFETYLKIRQKQVLHRALTENQEQIRQFSDLGVQLTFLLSVPVQRAYNQSFDDLQKQFAAAKTDSGRQKQVRAAVALNDTMIDRWALFAQMDNLYRAFPAAHQELAKAVGGKGGLTAVLEMSRSTERLHKIYETLRENNEKAARAEARNQDEP